MKKLFNSKKIALILAVMLMLSCMVFAGCNGDTDTATGDEVTTTATTEATKSENEIYAKFKPTEAFKDGEAVDLETVFGTGYAKYGDELILYNDGTFTAYIGISSNPDATRGTYAIGDYSEIELLYDNDTTETATAVTFDVKDEVQQIRILKGEVYVIFTRV